jgi:hypothetical protein
MKKNIKLDAYEQDIENNVEKMVPVSKGTKARFDFVIERRKTTLRHVLVAKNNLTKFSKSLILLKSSLSRIGHFDPKKDYTPDELEPFDALAGRFERVVELALKVFKSIH